MKQTQKQRQKTGSSLILKIFVAEGLGKMFSFLLDESFWSAVSILFNSDFAINKQINGIVQQ